MIDPDNDELRNVAGAPRSAIINRSPLIVNYPYTVLVAIAGGIAAARRAGTNTAT